MGIGPLAEYRGNRIGVSWQEMGFQTVGEPDFTTVDMFRRMGVQLRHRMKNSLIVTAAVPYRWHRRHSVADGVRRIKGLGDIELLIGKTLLDDVAIVDDWSTYIEIHLGGVLPVGRYDAQLHDDNLPLNFNIGRGAWAGLSRLTALVGYRQVGLALSTRIQLNAPTSNGYRFGHQYSQLALVYWDYMVSDEIVVTPYVGAYYEYLTMDRYANGRFDIETGGHGTFFNGGVTASWRDTELNIQYYIPMHHSYGSGRAAPQKRFSISILKSI